MLTKPLAGDTDLPITVDDLHELITALRQQLIDCKIAFAETTGWEIRYTDLGGLYATPVTSHATRHQRRGPAAILLAKDPSDLADQIRRQARPSEPSESPEIDSDEIDSDSILSPRETEVAELVRDGLSNRGIAEQLGISLRTVDSHIQHILIKLRFSSRAQVAAWVVQTPSRVPGGMGAKGPAAVQQGCGPAPPEVGLHPA